MEPIIICAVISLILIFYLFRDYNKGLVFSLFFLVFLPQNLGVVISESLPVLSIQRIIFIILFFFWIINKKHTDVKNLPYKILFLLIIISNSITVYLSDYFVVSFKQYLSVIVENILLFIILFTSLKDQNEMRKASLYVFNAITIIAIIGVFERYTNFRFLDLPFFERDFVLPREVYSTFPHPIHLGIATAIGLMLSLYFLSDDSYTKRRKLLYLKALTIGSCLYLTFSRGPWLAAMLGILVVFLFGNKNIQRKTLVILLFPLFIMLFSGGVYQYLHNFYWKTFDPYNMEGSSYHYRWELWKKAYSEVSKKPKRLAFGYGLGYHENEDLSGYFQLADKRVSYRSWDNDFAAVLLETGFVGLILYFVLYSKIVFDLYDIVKKRKINLINFGVLCLSVVLIVLFMMMSVRMFSKQVMILFYLFMAMGLNYRVSVNDKVEAQVNY